MKISGNILVLLIITFAFTSFGNKEIFDLCIKNAQVVDGTGGKPYFAKILVHEGKIASIEKDTSKIFEAREVIDAKGKVLAPGFIDTHAHGDPLATPAFENFLAMGVTTIFLGQDGSSPDTPDLATWMDRVDQAQPGPNIAMFVGHGTLRMLSGVGYDKNPSEQKLVQMDSLLADAMAAGSFGLSTGLEYNPGYLAEQSELNRLAKTVGVYGGMVMSHMRNEDDDYLEESLDELMAQGDFCRVHVSHIKIVYGKGEERANDILQVMEKERKSGKTVTADLYPYEASYTSISILFPEWAKPPANYQQVVKDRRDELETYLRNRVNSRNGPTATLIGSGPYKGKNLKEIAELEIKPFERVLVDDIGPSGTSAAYFVMDETVMKAFLIDENINICSDGSPTSNHPRSYGTFAKIIEDYVVKDPILDLSTAIYKMTGLSAKNVGITDRGTIKVGNKADLVIFEPGAVRARATYEDPAQLAEGFDYVFVNGKLAMQNQKLMERAGQIIKKEGNFEKKNILVVVGDKDDLNPSENQMLSRLKKGGYLVTVVNDDEEAPLAYHQTDLIIVSKTVNSLNVGNRYKDASCGFMTWEDNLQMGQLMGYSDNDGSEGTAWHSKRENWHLVPDAPESLGAGLKGIVQIYDVPEETTYSPTGSKVPESAIVVAEYQKDDLHKTYYVFEKGAQMGDGSSASGRRIYFGLYDDTFRHLSETGLLLFDSAVAWGSD